MSQIVPPVAVQQPPPPQPEPPERHPLNLPRGTVRSGLVLLIVLPFWVMLLSPIRLGFMPLYVYFLLGLVLVYFAAHGSYAIEGDEQSGLSWTGGIFLILIVLGTLALVVYLLLTKDQTFWPDRLAPPPNAAMMAPYLLIATLGGYGLGWLMSHLLGGWRNNYRWQDIQATISLIAMFLLTAGFVYTAFIQPQLPEKPDLSAPDTKVFESIVVAVVSWYFGARS
jgi:hypothetical protein